jgi:hypothetical protein
MSKTYEAQRPDGFTYQVTMPDNSDEGAIIERGYPGSRGTRETAWSGWAPIVASTSLPRT